MKTIIFQVPDEVAEGMAHNATVRLDVFHRVRWNTEDGFGDVVPGSTLWQVVEDVF